MRLTAYLCTSRHGIFYFRFPLPADLNPANKRSHLKLSLSTRNPSTAKFFSRLLTVAGHSLMTQPIVRSMRYDDMRNHVREHFSQMLTAFKKQTATDGPRDETGLDPLRASLALSEAGGDVFTATTTPDDADALLRGFCEARGIRPAPDSQQQKLLLAEIHKGYQDYLKRAIEHTEEFSTLVLDDQDTCLTSALLGPSRVI